MNKKVFPPTTKVRLSRHFGERWRRIVHRARTAKKVISLSDADLVVLIHLEELVDSLMEMGSACVDVYNRFKHLDVSFEAGPEVERVYMSYARWLNVRERIENIDPDLEVK